MQLSCNGCFKRAHDFRIKSSLRDSLKELGRHSRPQSPRSFWSAPRIETSGRDRSRKSANHGLPAFVRSLRNLNNNGYYRLQKWAAIALARYLAPARGLDPWRRPKGSWALGTRMLGRVLMLTTHALCFRLRTTLQNRREIAYLKLHIEFHNNRL